MKRKHSRMKPERARERAAHESASPGEPRAAQGAPGGLRSVWVLLSVVALTVVVIWFAVRLFKNRDSASQVAALQVASTLPGMPVPAGTKEVPSAAPSADQRHAKENDGRLLDLINRANQLLVQNKAAEAVDLLRQGRTLNPDDEDVPYNLGIALSRLGQNEEAVKEYEEALRLYPDYAEAHNNLGNLLLRMKRPDEAVKHFEQVISIMPDYASAWNNFGDALRQLGRRSEAHSYFEKAAQLDTNYWEAHFNLGLSYMQQKRFPEARTEFETVLRLQPGFAPAQQALARIGRETTPGPVRPE